MVRLKKIYPTEKYGKYANLQELVSASAMRFGDKPLYKYFDADGQIREMSYCTFGNETKAIGTALAAYGLLGKRIAILSESRPEWMVGYVATIGGGGVTIPLDRELQTEQIRNFLNLSEANAIFFSAPYEKALLEMAPELPGVRAFIAFDEPAEPWPAELADRLFVYRRMAEDGREMYENGNDAYTSAHVDVYAMSAIIFTSGTTGTSKGVMLSHDNLLECVRASANMVNFSSRDVLLSVLPLHHTYETCCGMLTPICLGATVCINNSLKYVVRNMNIFRPTGMILVPLFVSTIYKKICDEVRKKGKEKLLARGIAATKLARKVGIDLRKPVFAEVRRGLGGRLSKIICGGAALDPDLVDRFDELGIQIAQGYGITECAPLVSVNPYTALKYGSVGVPIRGSSIKILKENGDGAESEAETGSIGEICVKGPQVMLGYYNNPEATKEVFTDDGYFRTGDLGYVDDEGYIFITGRKKNVIILANGKNIYPEELEEYLYKLDVINECVVVAREVGGETLLTAVVYPEYTRFEGADAEQIKETIKAEIMAVNKHLPVFKQIRNIEIKKNEFEKTTSKKIIRYKV
ncbi:MAG: AMP-dependent synthetase [Clostridiales bacterium]|nr:MAG: AMP-dependent synthetase [Clostridiales bacterium]